MYLPWNPQWSFLVRLLKVLLINVSLSRDNAVVIALTVRKLPERMRLRALAVGITVAVIVLVAATFFATRLLSVPFLRFVGGILILWIAITSLLPPGVSSHAPRAHSQNFWHAIWFVIIADLTMSTDNILAVAAAAEGNLSLIVLSLGLSIPLLVLGSGFLPTLMDRWPSLIYLSAAVLGMVSGEIIMTDPSIVRALQPGGLFRHSVEGMCAIGVLGVGTVLRTQRRPVRATHRDRNLGTESGKTTSKSSRNG
jgi:YjbE family integral membrane protein